MQWAKRVVPWLCLGPVTGPLAEGAYRNFNAGEPVLAGLYMLAVAVAWFDMATVASHALNVLISH